MNGDGEIFMNSTKFGIQFALVFGVLASFGVKADETETSVGSLKTSWRSLQRRDLKTEAAQSSIDKQIIALEKAMNKLERDAGDEDKIKELRDKEVLLEGKRSFYESLYKESESTSKFMKGQLSTPAQQGVTKLFEGTAGGRKIDELGRAVLDPNATAEQKQTTIALEGPYELVLKAEKATGNSMTLETKVRLNERGLSPDQRVILDEAGLKTPEARQAELDRFTKDRLSDSKILADAKLNLNLSTFAPGLVIDDDKKAAEQLTNAYSKKYINENVGDGIFDDEITDLKGAEREAGRLAEAAEKGVDDNETYRTLEAKRALLEYARKPGVKLSDDICADLKRAGLGYDGLPEKLQEECKKSQDPNVMADIEAAKQREIEKKFEDKIGLQAKQIEALSRNQQNRSSMNSGQCGPDRVVQALQAISNQMNQKLGQPFDAMENIPMSGFCGRAMVEIENKMRLWGMDKVDGRVVTMSVGPAFFSNAIEETLKLADSAPQRGAKLEEEQKIASQNIEMLNFRIARKGGSNNPDPTVGKKVLEQSVCMEVERQISKKHQTLAGSGPMLTALNATGRSTAAVTPVANPNMLNGLVVTGGVPASMQSQAPVLNNTINYSQPPVFNMQAPSNVPSNTNQIRRALSNGRQ